jgi:predicted dinucleotide-binding enzyme
VFREFVPGARVVEAFNHFAANLLPEQTVADGADLDLVSRAHHHDQTDDLR